MAKHGAGYDIAGALAKQRELVNKGYKLAIDGDWGITGVHRPGTKEHPYKDKNGNYVSK